MSMVELLVGKSLNVLYLSLTILFVFRGLNAGMLGVGCVQRNVDTEQVKAALNAQQELQIDKVLSSYLKFGSVYHCLSSWIYLLSELCLSNGI